MYKAGDCTWKKIAFALNNHLSVNIKQMLLQNFRPRVGSNHQPLRYLALLYRRLERFAHANAHYALCLEC